MPKSASRLPKELTSLVHYGLDLLGKSAKKEYGSEVYQIVESIRREYKSQRSASDLKKIQSHRSVFNEVSKKSIQAQRNVAHVFATSLELINACENAYRSFRLSQMEEKPKVHKPVEPIIFVLTAHPTESRSPESIELLGKATDLFRKLLINPSAKEAIEAELHHLVMPSC